MNKEKKSTDKREIEKKTGGETRCQNAIDKKES